MPNLEKTTTQDRIYFELLEMRKRLDRLIIDYQATLPDRAIRKQIPVKERIKRFKEKMKNV